MKIIAMYLPQFHRVKENDEWWGEGFTDWVTVKRATPLFEGHKQPKIPLDKNYYDLADIDTMRWQASLMRKYGVDGICMYHYWFKDGRQILERPAENLLNEKGLDMPFCFCWANETWARSWSNVPGKNVWADRNEEKGQPSKNDRGILLDQQYGLERQWKDHFDYLLPFFLDKRYICIDGKPVFVFYRSADIPCLPAMTEYWRELALEAGLPGLHLIGVWAENPSNKGLDAELCHEPLRTRISHGELYGKLYSDLNYNDFYKSLLAYETGNKSYYGGFVSYDDTPRRGKKGYIINGLSVEGFRENLSKLIAKNEAHGNELVFVNAWNEWGEGMYLEPDEEYGYSLLEALQIAKTNYSRYLNDYCSKGILDAIKDPALYKKDKPGHYLKLLDELITIRENGEGITDWLVDHEITKIGVYGYGVLGKHFVHCIDSERIEVVFISDINCDVRSPYRMCSMKDEFPQTDAVIVTATFYFDEIYWQLREKGEKRIVSLQQVIEEAYIW